MQKKVLFESIRKFSLPIVVGSQKHIVTTPSALHFHNMYEILFISNGKYKVLAPQLIFEGEGPCIIFFSKGIYHSVVRIDCETVPFVCYDCYFSHELINDTDGKFFNIKPLINDDVIVIEIGEDEMKNLLVPRLNEARVSYVKHRASKTIHPLLYSHLSFLVNFAADCMEKNITKKFDTKTDSYITDVLKLIIEANEEGKDISVNEIADMFFVSVSKLSKNFKEVAGVSIKPMICNMKLERAMRLLEKGISVSEVSAMCGFSSDSYFIQFFNKHLGTSPGKYKFKTENNFFCQ